MAGLKYSKQRASIKDYLMHTTSHPTADTVYLHIKEEFPNISLGTVYRNLNLLASLQREGDAEERDLGDEGIALRTAMEHYEELGLEGGLIRVYGEVVAFTIGDRLSADTYDVHFEKAYGELQGAYAMINREFARWVRAFLRTATRQQTITS